MLTGNSYDPFVADIWALGVCLYVMVFGCLPFQGENEQEVYEAIKNQPLTFPKDTDVEISQDLRNLLECILDKNPATRISLHEIMMHGWVTDQGRIQIIPLEWMTSPPNEIQVSAFEADGAIVEDDRVLKMDFEERVFQDGEHLIQSGSTDNVLYFILSGAVEVKDPKWKHQRAYDRRISLTIRRDDSMMFYQIVEDDEDEDCEDIHLDMQSTAEISHRLQDKAMKDDAEDLVLEIKGPANIIGDVSICYPVRPYPYNIQARGQVHALELTSDKLNAALQSAYDRSIVYDTFNNNQIGRAHV
eukprot:TRINITY_DN1246_c0_g1_i1.p1 TRINITY_DN1246_c0_g1~~TRINITY_DN1246_c0_g1_i1.p1  ORF type:complete len:302 (-),score=28.30 TRINITY_DN1246_c0_g1_i1:50-955(-)